VLLASTSEVYGDHRTTEPLHENARRVYGPTTQKRWLYADSKAMDEYLALAYRQERDLDFVIARLFNTVGPRQSGQYGMVVARFVQAAVTGAPLEIHGDGNQTRTFCHVQDTIRALQGLMDSPATTGEIYNVGSKNWLTIAELAQRVLELTGSSSEIVYVPYDQVYGGGIDDMLHRLPAIEKITEAIGWQPERSLDEILTDVIAFARDAAASPA
jgi:UDP-glucose 4-epimerase